MNAADQCRWDDPQPRVLLSERDPLVFQQKLSALMTEPIDLVLIDPGTPQMEVDRIISRLRVERRADSEGAPHLESDEGRAHSYDRHIVSGRARLLIPTGGSTGAPKFAVHSWATLDAAAAGFCRAFPGPAHALCVLPLWHVGGLMQWVRALGSGGVFNPVGWSAVERGADRPDPEGTFLSLVPTQLQRLLKAPSAVGWLRRFRAVFLGGAAAWPSLLESAREAKVPLAPAYGSTETAAQVCCLRPEDFLSGKNGVGDALPHARLSVVDRDGCPVADGTVGRIRVVSDSLFLGYAGDAERAGEGYVTDDLGWMAEDGCLSVVGRSDDAINTGGEIVMPAEIETAIRVSGLASEVVVCGRTDPEWGEIVCALIVASDFPGDAEARERLRSFLPSRRIPRLWVRVEELPRTALGKLDRVRVASLIGSNDDKERNRRYP